MAEKELYVSRMLADLDDKLDGLMSKLDSQLSMLSQAVNVFGSGISNPNVIGSAVSNLTELVPAGSVYRCTLGTFTPIGVTLRATADGFLTFSGHVTVSGGDGKLSSVGSSVGYTDNGTPHEAFCFESNAIPPFTRDFAFTVPLVKSHLYRFGFNGMVYGLESRNWVFTFTSANVGWNLFNIVENGPFVVQ